MNAGRVLRFEQVQPIQWGVRAHHLARYELHRNFPVDTSRLRFDSPQCGAPPNEDTAQRCPGAVAKRDGESDFLVGFISHDLSVIHGNGDLDELLQILGEEVNADAPDSVSFSKACSAASL